MLENICLADSLARSVNSGSSVFSFRKAVTASPPHSGENTAEADILLSARSLSTVVLVFSQGRLAPERCPDISLISLVLRSLVL